MDLMQAIEERHAVQVIETSLFHMKLSHTPRGGHRTMQRRRESSLPLVRMSLRLSRLASYGMFKGVRDCIAFVGRQEDGLEEKIGYYGELIALEAQRAGLNSCWVALTYRKKHLKAYRTRRNGVLAS